MKPSRGYTIHRVDYHGGTMNEAFDHATTPDYAIVLARWHQKQMPGAYVIRRASGEDWGRLLLDGTLVPSMAAREEKRP